MKKNYSHKSFYRPKKQESLNFRRETTDSQSDLKELRVKLEAILSAFETFCKNCSEY